MGYKQMENVICLLKGLNDAETLEELVVHLVLQGPPDVNELAFQAVSVPLTLLMALSVLSIYGPCRNLLQKL